MSNIDNKEEQWLFINGIRVWCADWTLVPASEYSGFHLELAGVTRPDAHYFFAEMIATRKPVVVGVSEKKIKFSGRVSVTGILQSALPESWKGITIWLACNEEPFFWEEKK